MMVSRDGVGREEWDAAVSERGGGLHQTWAWGELHHRHGHRVERIRTSRPAGVGLAQLLFRHRGPVSIAYLPRGPIVEGDPAVVVPAVFDAIDDVCTGHRTLVLTVEPPAALQLAGAKGFSPSVRRWHHSRTVKVPLLDDEPLLAQMHHETRRKIRRAGRQGVVVERAAADAAATEAFYDLLKETARRNAYGIEPRAYYEDFLRLFGDDAVLLFARADGRTVATGISVRVGDEGISWQAASSTEHRVRGATDLLQFEAMRWARERGCARYDMGGLPPEDPPPPVDGQAQGSRGADWSGMYWFKTGFGGEIVAYPPAVERRYHRALAWLAQRVT